MDLQLNDKTALITGSTAGIGYASAKKLLQEGAKVYINGRGKDRVEEAVSTLKDEVPNANVHGVAADFSKKEEIDQITREIPDVDVLINNVGIFAPKEFEKITDEEWMLFFEVNVMSGVRLSRHYFPKMINKNWGRIIFISSESAIQIPEEMIHYGTTKTAQLGLSRGLAERTKGTNVTVNTILPGPTRSEGVGGFIENLASDQQKTKGQVEEEFFQHMRPTSLINRFADTEEVANLIVYVSSPLSSATNGAALRVDGGVVRSIV